MGEAIAEARKVGIADAGPPQNLFERKLGREMAAARFAAHTNDVAEVINQVREQFPTLPKDAVLKLVLATPKRVNCGVAYLRDNFFSPGRMAVQSKVWHQKRVAGWAAEAAKRAAEARFAIP